MAQEDGSESEEAQDKGHSAGPGQGVAPEGADRRQDKHQGKEDRQGPSSRFHKLREGRCGHKADQ